jgi:putative transcriptional regulator
MPSTVQSCNLTDQFLIAMPAMADPYFSGTLVYICEHNEQGALGIIVNRPIDMTLAALFEKIEQPLETAGFERMPVYFGGPVQTDRGFVLHRPLGGWQSTLTVNRDIGLTSSRDILQSVGRQGDPQEIIVTLGYSGWSAGQLEEELGQNAWLTVPAQQRILFEMPFEDRLAAAMDVLGISFANLAEDAGHA